VVSTKTNLALTAGAVDSCELGTVTSLATR